MYNDNNNNNVLTSDRLDSHYSLFITKWTVDNNQ